MKFSAYEAIDLSNEKLEKNNKSINSIISFIKKNLEGSHIDKDLIKDLQSSKKVASI